MLVHIQIQLLFRCSYRFLDVTMVTNHVVGCQVIYLTDAVDEYLTQNLTEYEEKKFQNASKDDLKLGSKDEKAKFKKMKESYKELTKWWKDLLSGELVESVKVGSLLLFRVLPVGCRSSRIIAGSTSSHKPY